MRTAIASTPARAALAGNPSDGYGGATLAVCLEGLAATATVRERPRRDGPAAPSGADGEPAVLGAGHPLVRAALARFSRLAELPEVNVEVTTTIPREVGLAGSSAIVISVLRALGELTGSKLDDATLAATALAAETEELGIAAGPQDRVVQVHGGLLAMDFSRGAHEALDPALLPPLLVAWRRDGGEPSGTVHGELRARFASGDPAVLDGVRALAGHAARARDALVAGDHEAFAACVDGSFDARAAMVDLDPVDASLVRVAREHGAAANYAGSGGAIVGVARDANLDVLAREYARRGHGFAPARPAAGPANAEATAATAAWAAESGSGTSSAARRRWGARDDRP